MPQTKGGGTNLDLTHPTRDIEAGGCMRKSRAKAMVPFQGSFAGCQSPRCAMEMQQS